MNWKWQRSLYCQAGFLAILLALPCQPLAIAAQAQQNATVKGSAASAAQQPTSPAPSPTDATDQPVAPDMFVIRSNRISVTTPVTVFDSGGNFAYDLEQNEFKIYDNGVQQDITSFDSEMRRLSLVIVVETNDATAPFLDSVHPLGSMFSEMVMGPQGEVAVVTYSDRVEMPLGFTQNGDQLDTVLRGLHGRGGGMHLDDALNFALARLDSRPKEDRKVIVAFSDGFNIGSKMSRSEIVKRAMNSDITLYGLGFSPVKGLWKRPAKDPPPDLVTESVARGGPTPNAAPTPTSEDNIWNTSDINIVSILLGLGEEAKKPVFKSSLQSFSTYSGGRYYQKWGKDTVQEALNQIATEIHSQYELAYTPTSPIQVGFHTIKVEARRPGAKVRARSGWFYQGEPPRGVRVRN